MERHLYVKAVLDLYRRTPGTLGHARPEDRRLAGILYDRGVSLEQVDAALARLDAGTFGTCIRCGRAIAAERLEALPWAAHCIDCRRELDRGRQ